jgi:hypothetical protein
MQHNYKQRIQALHEDLESAQQAVAALDEPKQENLMLKVTIDRMRFDMDEMRMNAMGGRGGGMGESVQGSMSKSFGAELSRRMKEMDAWEAEEPEEPEPRDEEEIAVGEIDDGEETEGEDMLQTIITRTKQVSSFFVPSDTRIK